MKATSYIFKYFIPKTLVSRFLLIIALPVIIAQLVAIYIFYERHWSNILNSNASTIAREVKLVSHIYMKHGIENATAKARILSMSLVHSNDDIIKNDNNKKYAAIEILTRALESNIKTSTKANLIKDDTEIEILHKVPTGTLIFTRSIKHLVHPTTYIFIIWMISLTFLLLIVSLIFTRNQIKSILSLANAADNFICSNPEKLNYKPSGAAEIRKAGFAFLKMKNRIENYIVKRTQTLAMISHDLKTPLTRMSLQLEMLDENSKEIQDMKSDVANMSQMIDTYLDFARGEGGEKMRIASLLDWFKKSLKTESYRNINIKFEEKSQNPKVHIKPIAFVRAIDNIISNANKYAKNVLINIKVKDNSVVLDIEDDGEGISDDMKLNVFKPFYRVDTARNVGTHGSVGLGLSITNEIILGHNGMVKLLDGEKLGGLMVRIILPLTSS